MFNFDENGRVNIAFEDVKNTFTHTSRFNASKEKLNFSFVYNSKKFFFKSNAKYSYDQNEILATLVANAMGLKNSQPSPACFTDENGEVFNGIVSLDVVKSRKKTETIPYKKIIENFAPTPANLTVEYIIDSVKEFIRGKSIEIDKNLRTDLVLLSLFYYITGQQDSNPSNIEFDITKQVYGKKILSLTPFVDKTICFFMRTHFIQGLIYPNIDTIKLDPINESNKLPYFMAISRDLYSLNNISRIYLDFGLEINKNQVLAKAIYNLCNFDFEKAIENYSNKTKFVFDTETKQRAILFFNANLDYLKQEFLPKIQKIYKFENNLKSNNKELDLTF